LTHADALTRLGLGFRFAERALQILAPQNLRPTIGFYLQEIGNVFMRTEPEVLAPVVQELAKHNALTLTTRRDRGRRRLRWDDWSRVLGPALLCPLGTAAIGITRLTPCQGARELRFFERSRRVAAYGELCGNGVLPRGASKAFGAGDG